VKFLEQPHSVGGINSYKKSSFEITKVPDYKPQREILMDEKCIKRKGFL